MTKMQKVNEITNEVMMANAIRMLSADAVQKANSGHPGMPLGMADVVTVLFNRFMNIDPSTPDWADRDRFILSAGHGSMLLYSLHHLLGYDDMTIEEIKNFRQMGARTAGHPEYGHAAGIETTTGPLGQGLTTAVGMAIAERMQSERFGADLVDHYTYVVVGDGCLQEGISHEAIDLAGHLKLKKLIVLWDDNEISIDGATSVSTSANQQARFVAMGWHVHSVDGHNQAEVADAIGAARKSDQPSLIACKTKIGKGAPNLEGSAKTHGAPLGEDEIKAMRTALKWPYGAFEIPSDVKENWEQVSVRGQDTRKKWAARLIESSQKDEFLTCQKKKIPATVFDKLEAFKAEHFKAKTKVATRKASQMALEIINGSTSQTIGGSADLTGSNLTKTSQTESITPDNFSGRYIHYGIREHAMSAVMNGISLHGGFTPYGGTFFVFSDYMRGGMRLSALMGQRVIYVLTHDSIGLGEDGPTHQPIEHLAMMRATPNTNVFRPADIIETAECWAAALQEKSTPSVLALSRQGLPMLRSKYTTDNLSARGAYVLREPKKPRQVTLLATGSEVEIAVQAAEELEAIHGVFAAVVSMPCWEKFEEQSPEYQEEVLGSTPRIGVEAAARFGWDKWINSGDCFIGMNGFGASAPAPDLYKFFGITSKHVVAKALELIK